MSKESQKASSTPAADKFTGKGVNALTTKTPKDSGEKQPADKSHSK